MLADQHSYTFLMPTEPDTKTELILQVLDKYNITNLEEYFSASQESAINDLEALFLSVKFSQPKYVTEWFTINKDYIKNRINTAINYLLLIYFLYYEESKEHEEILEIITTNISESDLSRMAQNKFFINKKTPLHYAVEHDSLSNIKFLLNLGASLSALDAEDHMPILALDLDFLDEHFNSCIKENPITDEIEIDFSTLIYDDGSESCSYQTEFISELGKHQKFRSLLIHPLISTFLYIKWEKCKFYFMLNVTVFLLYVLALFLYIFFPSFALYSFKSIHFEKEDFEKTRMKNINLFLTFKLFLLVMNFLLSIRQLWEIYVYKIEYCRKVDDWIELLLIYHTFWIISEPEDIVEYIGILFILVVVDFYFLISSFPVFTVYVTMFRQVSLNFFKHIIVHILLIFAFGTGFQILLYRDHHTYIESLLKTFVMFAGEYNTDENTFSSYSLYSNVAFISFLIVVPIILQNLLIGLAVSDLQRIQNEAELLENKERAEFILNIEKLYFKLNQKLLLDKKMKPIVRDLHIIYAKKKCGISEILRDKLSAIVENKNHHCHSHNLDDIIKDVYKKLEDIKSEVSLFREDLLQLVENSKN